MNFRSQNNGEFSTIRELLTDCLEDLGGYSNAAFSLKDKGERLQKLQSLVSDDMLDIEKAQATCIRVDKIQKVIVNPKSTVRDLNLGVLMTHDDFIGEVYFHRGNALMLSKRWNQAIQDFNLAIKYRCAGVEEFRIQHKIGQCLIKKKAYTRAVKCFRCALAQLTAEGDLNQKTKSDFTKILTDCITKFSAKKDEISAAPLEFKPLSPSKIDPRVTDQVEVIETIGKGRNAFAKNNIPVGAVLAVVDAIGAHLNPDNAAQVVQYCLHCLLAVEVPYPCSTCPRVVFCSEECKLEAQNSYHKYQCQLDLFNIRVNDTKDGCTIFHSLAIIFSQPATFWTKNQDEFLKSSSSGGDWPAPVGTDVQKLALLFQMAANEDDVSSDTHARHAIVVVLLLRAIRKTTYYSDAGLETPTKGFNKHELVIGQLIYKLRLIQDMNSHPIWGVGKHQKDKIAKDHIGAGLYTGIGSYFNSDCNPNTIRVNIGRKMLLIASKNIKRGVEVMDNYCIHFSELPTVSRRPWIKEHFLFDCSCEACENDWPTYSNLPQDRPNQKVSDKLVALEMENIESIENGNIDKALISHQKEITLIQGGLNEPHQLPVTIRKSFQLCWWKKVVDYLQKLDAAS